MGISGLAMARWCARLGDAVTLIDTRSDPERLAAAKATLPDMTVRQGALDGVTGPDADWDEIYVSPGLSPDTLAPLTAWASAHGRRIGNELDLFIDGLKAHEPPPSEPVPDASTEEIAPLKRWVKMVR